MLSDEQNAKFIQRKDVADFHSFWKEYYRGGLGRYDPRKLPSQHGSSQLAVHVPTRPTFLLYHKYAINVGTGLPICQEV